MPIDFTFYAYMFEGEPPDRRAYGWLQSPDGTAVSTRARGALFRAATTMAAVYRCAGALDAAGDLACERARLLARFDAGPALAAFARYCARTVLARWPAPACVHDFVAAGDPALQADAHRAAWEASWELTGAERVAARVAMYATEARALVSTVREAASLAARLAGERITQARQRQERVLAAELLARTAAQSMACVA